MSRQMTVAIAGLGSRGRDTYAKAKDEDDIYNIKHNAYNIDIAYIIMVMLTHYISSAKLGVYKWQKKCWSLTTKS